MQEKVLGMEINVGLGLTYLILAVMGIIILVADKEASRYVKFHAWQSIFLAIVILVLMPLTCGVGSILVGVYTIVIAILMFTGKDHRVPGVAALADKCVK